MPVQLSSAQSSECTMEKWAEDLGLSANPLALDNYGIQKYNKLSRCSAYTSSSGSDNDAVVVGCIFDGGHVCNTNYMDTVMLNFFDLHPRVGNTASTSK